MNAGKFSAQFLMEWLDPANRAERKQRRKAARQERRMAEKLVLTTETGEKFVHTPPLIAANTSTKLAVGSGVIGSVPAVEFLQWVQSLDMPWAWLESATNSGYFIYYGAIAIAYVIAKMSKSPLKPQAV